MTFTQAGGRKRWKYLALSPFGHSFICFLYYAQDFLIQRYFGRARRAPNPYSGLHAKAGTINMITILLVLGALSLGMGFAYWIYRNTEPTHTTIEGLYSQLQEIQKANDMLVEEIKRRARAPISPMFIPKFKEEEDGMLTEFSPGLTSEEAAKLSAFQHKIGAINAEPPSLNIDTPPKEVVEIYRVMDSLSDRNEIWVNGEELKSYPVPKDMKNV